MKAKTVFCITLVLVLSLMLSSCNFLGLGIWEILPEDQYQQLLTDKADLETANAKLTADLNTANASITQKDLKIDNLNTEKFQLSGQLADFGSILCKQSWNEAYSNIEVFRADKGDLVGLQVFYTQWLPLGSKWNQYTQSTTLIIDIEGVQAFIMDTRNNCIVVNPEFIDLGQPVNGSSS